MNPVARFALGVASIVTLVLVNAAPTATSHAAPTPITPPSRDAGVTETMSSAPVDPAIPADDELFIYTSPAAPGVVFTFDDVEHVTGPDGVAVIEQAGDLDDISDRLNYERFDGRADTGIDFDRFAGLDGANRTRQVTGRLTIARGVTFGFEDLDGNRVDSGRIDTFIMKSSLGVFFELGTDDLDVPIMLPAARSVATSTGFATKDIYYTVQSVLIDGADTVNRSQQKFFPQEIRHVEVETQFFHVDVSATDALFSFANGSAVLVRWPDGAQTRHEVVNGLATLPPLPRGEYQMRIDGSGLTTWRPVSITRDQTVDLELMSSIDIAAVIITLLGISSALILVGRRRHRGRAGALAPPTGEVEPL